MLIRAKDMKDKAIETTNQIYIYRHICFEEGNFPFNGNRKHIIKENREDWKSKTTVLKLSNVIEVTSTVA
jgi:protein tyrosine/serine phosphatase